MNLSLVDQHAQAPEYPEALTPMAWTIGQEKVLADMDLFGSFIRECEGGEREPSWCGPISTEHLFTKIMFKPEAEDWQLREAINELKKRYLAEHEQYIREAAERAMR